MGRPSLDPCDARVRDHLPQLHVADVVGAAVAYALRHASAVEDHPSAQCAAHVQRVRSAARRIHQARPDPVDHGAFLPREYVEELEALQDDVPPTRYKRIASTFVASFGKQPEDVFTSFNRDPIAAASLGQVHEARNAAGDRLAVKILYPNVATIIKVDLRVLGWAIRVYRNFVPVQQIERVHELVHALDLLHRARSSCSTRIAQPSTRRSTLMIVATFGYRIFTASRSPARCAPRAPDRATPPRSARALKLVNTLRASCRTRDERLLRSRLIRSRRHVVLQRLELLDDTRAARTSP